MISPSTTAAPTHMKQPRRAFRGLFIMPDSRTCCCCCRCCSRSPGRRGAHAGTHASTERGAAAAHHLQPTCQREVRGGPPYLQLRVRVYDAVEIGLISKGAHCARPTGGGGGEPGGRCPGPRAQCRPHKCCPAAGHLASAARSLRKKLPAQQARCRGRKCSAHGGGLQYRGGTPATLNTRSTL